MTCLTLSILDSGVRPWPTLKINFLSFIFFNILSTFSRINGLCFGIRDAGSRLPCITIDGFILSNAQDKFTVQSNATQSTLLSYEYLIRDPPDLKGKPITGILISLDLNKLIIFAIGSIAKSLKVIRYHVRPRIKNH